MVALAAPRALVVGLAVFWATFLLAEQSPAAGPIRFTQPYSVVGGNTVNVHSEIWAPDSAKRLKGVVVWLPGRGHDARVYARNPLWQAHAEALGFAVLGLEFAESFDPADTYVGDGPEQVAQNMQSMLDRMADELNHPELSNAPVFLFGHSHGGYTGSLVAQSFGERTLGFMLDKGAEFPYDPLTPGFAEVPGVFQLGSSDNTTSAAFMSYAYESWREQGAKVAQGVDWAGHNITTESYVFAYLDQVTKARYPEGAVPSRAADTPLELNVLEETDGWLVETNPVNLSTNVVTRIEWPEIGPADEFTGDPLERSWVPTEMMAKVLRADNGFPYLMAKSELRIFVNPTDASETELEVSVGTIAQPYNTLELYDENGLVASFGPGSGPKLVSYNPTENGIYTFLAIINYTRDGGSHMASSYGTYAVTELPVVPEPASAMVMAGALAWLAARQRRRVTRPESPRCGMGRRCRRRS